MAVPMLYRDEPNSDFPTIEFLVFGNPHGSIPLVTIAVLAGRSSWLQVRHAGLQIKRDSKGGSFGVDVGGRSPLSGQDPPGFGWIRDTWRTTRLCQNTTPGNEQMRRENVR